MDDDRQLIELARHAWRASYASETVARTLLKRLDGVDGPALAWALHALGRARRREALPAGVRWIANGCEATRARAAAALGEFGGIEAVAALQAAAADPSAEVRERVLLALQHCATLAATAPSTATITMLLAGLDDHEVTVRVAAAFALRCCNDHAGVAERLLLCALADPHDAVRIAAAESLRDALVSYPELGEQLARACASGNPHAARVAQVLAANDGRNATP
jgi:HEAT repeat protein